MISANLDLPNLGSVFACNNGSDPTVYYGRIPNTNRRKDPGFVVVRTDIGNTDRVMFEHGDRASTAMFIRVQDVELEVDGADTTSPPPTAILRNVNTGDVIDMSAAPAAAAQTPTQTWTAMSGPGGIIAETTVADPDTGASIALVQEASTASATSAALVVQNSCETYYGQRDDCLGLSFGNWGQDAVWGLSIYGFYRTLTAATVDAVDVGIGVVGLAAFAAPSVTCLDGINVKVKNCFMPDCTNGRCDLLGTGCIALPPQFGGGQQLCDLSCQTCELWDVGVPYCKGLHITALDYDADVVDSGFCGGPNAITSDLTIHYCGRTNGYTGADWGVKTGGCPSGWTCPINIGVFLPQATNPVTLENALSCCSNNTPLPVTFDSICSLFDKYNYDFADFAWNCVKQ